MARLLVFAILGCGIFLSPAYADQADLKVQTAAVSVLVAGQTLEYDIYVWNLGPSDAANVSWSTTLPAHTTFRSINVGSYPSWGCTGGATVTCFADTPMSSGSSASFTLKVDVDPATPDGTSIDDVVTVTSSTPDAESANNSFTRTVMIVQVDMAVAVGTATYVRAGDDMSWTVEVMNHAPTPAEGVTLTNVLDPQVTFKSLSQGSGPALSCTVPEVGSSGTISCTAASFAQGMTLLGVSVHVPNLPNGTLLWDSAQVSTTSNDRIPENDSQTTGLTVRAPVTMTIDTSGPSTIPAGKVATWHVTLSNSGPSAQAHAGFSMNVVPFTAAQFVSATQTSGRPLFQFNGSSSFLNCNGEVMESGESASFDVVFAINGPVGTQISTSATVHEDVNAPLQNFDHKAATTTSTIVGVSPRIVHFQVAPTDISAGSSAVLSWHVDDADAVSIDQGIGAVASSGSIKVSPSETTTYTLSATGAGGIVVTATATVTVMPQEPPVVQRFIAVPATITFGQASHLTWAATNAVGVTIDGISGVLPPGGVVEVHPTVTTTYLLTAFGPGGTATAQATVTVKPSRRRPVSH